MRASLVLLKLPPSWPKRILGNSAIPWQGKPPDCHFHWFFISVGSPSPTSKIQHWLKLLAFKTCPNCIGRSWISSTERPERQLHSWTAMFTTEHFRRPSLHETISHLCLEKTRHARFLPYEFMPVESVQVKCQFLVKTSQHLNFFFFFGRLRIGEPEHLRMRGRNVWTRKKNAVPPDVALERRTKRVIPGFRPVRSLLDAVGPSLLSATDLASWYGIEGEICRPLNHMRQIPRLLTAPNRSCQFNIRIRWLIYSRKKSFYLSYGKHRSRRLQSVRTRPAKGNTHLFHLEFQNKYKS